MSTQLVSVWHLELRMGDYDHPAGTDIKQPYSACLISMVLVLGCRVL